MSMRHGAMMDVPLNIAGYIMQPAYPPKSHAAVLFSSQPPAQPRLPTCGLEAQRLMRKPLPCTSPAPCSAEEQRLLHKRNLRAEAQMRRREKLKQRKMPPSDLQPPTPAPIPMCEEEQERLLRKRSLRAAAQMRWRERGKARKVLAALSERLVRAVPTKFQFQIQKEWVSILRPPEHGLASSWKCNECGWWTPVLCVFSHLQRVLAAPNQHVLSIGRGFCERS